MRNQRRKINNFERTATRAASASARRRSEQVAPLGEDEVDHLTLQHHRHGDVVDADVRPEECRAEDDRHVLDLHPVLRVERDHPGDDTDGGVREGT